MARCIVCGQRGLFGEMISYHRMMEHPDLTDDELERLVSIPSKDKGVK